MAEQQEPQFNPAEARTFLQAYVPDPKVLETMPDDQVAAYHGRVSGELTKAQQKALETHDWRGSIAGEDVEAKKQLERFTSPKAVWESYKELKGQRDRGELKAVKPFPDKGTDEQKTAWRAENGVPPAPDKYEVKLEKGELTDADKPAVDAYLKYAHDNNLPADVVNKNVNWWIAARTQREQEAAVQFDTQKTETAAELGKRWGADYTPNMNRITGLLDATLPSDDQGKELRKLIDKAIATNPMYAEHYATLALQMNPTSTLTSAGPGATEGTIVDEIKKIETARRTDRKAYDKDEKTKERLRALYTHYQKVTGKEWGQD